MSNTPLSRRDFLTSGTAAVAGAALTGGSKVASSSTKRFQQGTSPWPISIDTATIRPASLDEKIRIADEAGYDGIEPWEGELDEYEEDGGDLQELGREIADRGLAVPNVVALWDAIPTTQEEWEGRQEDHRRGFRMASDIGATYIQTVLGPAREWHEYDLGWAADRYHDLLEMGINEFGVIPAINFLQFLPHVQRIGQASAIALDANHPDAKIIPDTFHMYTGGSGQHALKHIQGSMFGVFQINDVPADPPREELEDEHRVYPGDGILPLHEMLRDLRDSGFEGSISLQLFNPTYWEQDLLDVARTGLQKTVQTIEEALA